MQDLSSNIAVLLFQGHRSAVISTHLDGAQTGARFQGVNRPKTRPNQILVDLWLSDAIIKIVELQVVIRCWSIKIASSSSSHAASHTP